MGSVSLDTYIAQLLGAFVGRAIVVWVHQPYYVETENPNNILGTFSTISQQLTIMMILRKS